MSFPVCCFFTSTSVYRSLIYSILLKIDVYKRQSPWRSFLSSQASQSASKKNSTVSTMPSTSARSRISGFIIIPAAAKRTVDVYKRQAVIEVTWGIGTFLLYFIGISVLGVDAVPIGTFTAFAMYLTMFWDPIPVSYTHLCFLHHRRSLRSPRCRRIHHTVRSAAEGS